MTLRVPLKTGAENGEGLKCPEDEIGKWRKEEEGPRGNEKAEVVT